MNKDAEAVTVLLVVPKWLEGKQGLLKKRPLRDRHCLYFLIQALLPALHRSDTLPRAEKGRAWWRVQELLIQSRE